MQGRKLFWMRIILLTGLVILVVVIMSTFRHMEDLDEEEARLILNYSQYQVEMTQEREVLVLDRLAEGPAEERIVATYPYEQWVEEGLEERYAPIENEDDFEDADEEEESFVEHTEE